MEYTTLGRTGLRVSVAGLKEGTDMIFRTLVRVAGKGGK